MLLEQTKGTGVDVYTHQRCWASKLLPSIQKWQIPAGNCSNAWWKQKEEFESLNDHPNDNNRSIVPITSADVTMDNRSSTRDASTSTVKRAKTKDFSAITEQAKQCPPPTEIEIGSIVGGFGTRAGLHLADKVVDAVKRAAQSRSS